LVLLFIAISPSTLEQKRTGGRFAADQPLVNIQVLPWPTPCGIFFDFDSSAMYPPAVQLWENFVSAANRDAQPSVDSNQQPRKKRSSAGPRGRSIMPSVELRSGTYTTAPRDIREVAMQNQRGNRGGPEALRMELTTRISVVHANAFIKRKHNCGAYDIGEQPCKIECIP
jgi:hypothetical protein